MLSPTLDTIRLFLHVLSASIWVGGQFTLAGLVPALRTIGPDAPKAAARQFARVAWPAFGVAFLTGLWNLTEVSFSDRSTAYQVTLMVKLLVVAASGVSAAVHAGARTKPMLALFGALSALTALGAMFLGVLLHG